LERDVPFNGRASGAEPGNGPPSAFMSQLTNKPGNESGKGHNAPPAGLHSPWRSVSRENTAAELHSLIDDLQIAVRRSWEESFLRGSIRWWNWILVGLIAAAAFSPKLVGIVILAVILAALAGAIVALRVWRTRLSIYAAACRLDLAAGLHDRISTALYFGDAAQPDGIMLLQRRDALKKAHGLDLRKLFPVRLPDTRRALALAVVVAGLFTYRMFYRPPMTALLQTTARSRLVQAMLAPLRKKDTDALQRTASQGSQDAEAAAQEKRPAESAQSPDDLMPPPRAAVAGQENAEGANADDQQQGQPTAQGTASPSLSQALLDALKSMFANQPPPEGANAQARPPDGTQAANQAPGNPGDGGDQKDSQDGADSQQKNPKGTASGAGDTQAGSKELRKSTPLSVKAIPDRVPLQSANLKDQPLVDVSAEAGTSKIATGNAMPQAVTAANGGEQEGIPARYRAYVQRYFEHNSGNGQP